jgi:hypothetical protein
MKKIAIISLFLFLVPSISFAATLTPGQVNAILSLLEAFGVNQQTIAIVETELNPTATTTRPAATAASVIPASNSTTPSTPTAYAIKITRAFGSGSWEEYNNQCGGGRTPNIDAYDCGNRFLDGIVRFTINQPFGTAVLTYYPVNNSSNKVTTGGLWIGNAAEAGFFHPNTEYAWQVTATNNANQTAADHGTFITGDYPN